MYQGKTPEKIEGVFCGTMFISSAWYIEGRVEDRFKGRYRSLDGGVEGNGLIAR